MGDLPLRCRDKVRNAMLPTAGPEKISEDRLNKIKMIVKLKGLALNFESFAHLFNRDFFFLVAVLQKYSKVH